MQAVKLCDFKTCIHRLYLLFLLVVAEPCIELRRAVWSNVYVFIEFFVHVWAAEQAKNLSAVCLQVVRKHLPMQIHQTQSISIHLKLFFLSPDKYNSNIHSLLALYWSPHTPKGHVCLFSGLMLHQLVANNVCLLFGFGQVASSLATLLGFLFVGKLPSA